MKKRTFGFLVVASLIVLAACEYLPVTGDSNLPGTWDFTYYSSNYYENGILDAEQSEEMTDLGTVTFSDNGSGSYSFKDMDGVTRSGTFDWVENGDKLLMNLLTFADSITTDNLAIAWDVETNSATNQVWTAEVTSIEEDDDMTMTNRREYEVRLEKQ